MSIVGAMRRAEAAARGGLRPFNPYTDLAQVADLIGLAFAGRLDLTGQVALEEMRRLARAGVFSWILLKPTTVGMEGLPGFVCEREGRIVGNVSVRRAPSWGGYLIGNVAVHPAWRRQGIGRTLMESALEAITERGARWVGLEVRVDNSVARSLYEQLGFREIGSTTSMVCLADQTPPISIGVDDRLRRGLADDGPALVKLMSRLIDEPQRSVLELRNADYRPPGWMARVDGWFNGRRERWWLLEKGSAGLVCAARSVRMRGKRPHRIEILVHASSASRWAPSLLSRAINDLGPQRRKAIETVVVDPAPALVGVLEDAGFRVSHRLTQMRMHLARTVPVSVSSSAGRLRRI